MVILLAEGGEQVSAIFTALESRRRRYALYCLRETDEAVTTERLAAEIAAMEREQAARELPEDVQQEIHIELVHNHLPTLNQANLIDYDRRSGDVRYQLPHPLLDKCLDLATQLDRPE